MKREGQSMKENKEGRKEDEEMRLDSWEIKIFQIMTADHHNDAEICDEGWKAPS